MREKPKVSSSRPVDLTVRHIKIKIDILYGISYHENGKSHDKGRAPHHMLATKLTSDGGGNKHVEERKKNGAGPLTKTYQMWQG